MKYLWYKLISSTCIIQISIIDGNKYKRSGNPSINSTGGDTYSNINVDTSTKIISVTINNDEYNILNWNLLW